MYVTFLLKDPCSLLLNLLGFSFQQILLVVAQGINFKVLDCKKRELARLLLTCGEGRRDHLKDELSVLQLLGKNVTLRFRFHVKTYQERRALVVGVR